MGRYHDFHSVAEAVKLRHQAAAAAPPYQAKSAQKNTASRLIERFETDQVARQIRDIFFDQWSNSKIMCS